MKNNVPDETLVQEDIRKIIINGSVQQLETLINDGYNLLALEKNGYTLLEQACICGRLDMVKWFYQNKADFRKERYELSYAAAQNEIDILRYLLSSGADPSGVDETGRNGLHWAAQEDYRDICELLLKNKCCVNQMESSGQTALYIAAAENNYVIAEMLLKANAHTELCGLFDGTTPFMIACRFSNFSICDLLLSYGADIDACDSDGRSALFHANVRCAQDATQYLLARGADPSVEDKNGITPQSICENSKLQKLLHSELYVD